MRMWHYVCRSRVDRSAEPFTGYSSCLVESDDQMEDLIELLYATSSSTSCEFSVDIPDRLPSALRRRSLQSLGKLLYLKISFYHFFYFGPSSCNGISLYLGSVMVQISIYWAIWDVRAIPTYRVNRLWYMHTQYVVPSLAAPSNYISHASCFVRSH